MRTAFVYVIGLARNPVKVGIARDPKDRLSALQIGCPDELTLHHSVRLPAKVVGEVESAAHRALSEHRRRGEWFNLDADDAFDTVIRVARPIVNDYAEKLAEEKVVTVEEMVAQKLVSPWAREGVAEYRRQINSIDGREKVEATHEKIRQHAGPEALLAFKRSITSGREDAWSLRRAPEALRNYRLTLAKALNVVAWDFSSARESMLLDEIEKIVA